MEIIKDEICDLCGERKKFLRFDKLKGVDIPDREGYFCYKCLNETGKLENDS